MKSRSVSFPQYNLSPMAIFSAGMASDGHGHTSQGGDVEAQRGADGIYGACPGHRRFNEAFARGVSVSLPRDVRCVETVTVRVEKRGHN